MGDRRKRAKPALIDSRLIAMLKGRGAVRLRPMPWVVDRERLGPSTGREDRWRPTSTRRKGLALRRLPKGPELWFGGDEIRGLQPPDVLELNVQLVVFRGKARKHPLPPGYWGQRRN